MGFVLNSYSFHITKLQRMKKTFKITLGMHIPGISSVISETHRSDPFEPA